MSSWQDLKIYKKSWTNPKVARGNVARRGSLSSDFRHEFAFALGARQLIEAGRLEATVMPVAYMQRHSLELAIKSLSEMVYEIRACEATCDAVEWIEPKLPKPTHDYDEMLQEAEEALRTASEHLPPDFRTLASEYEKFEAGKPDRLRYPTVRKGKGTERSFRRYEVDLIQRQESLEVLLETHMSDADELMHSTTLYGRLLLRVDELTQASTTVLYNAGKF